MNDDRTDLMHFSTRRTIGILLAGGLSRRFGSPKAFARLCGNDPRMFYERALDALRETCDAIVIVTNPALQSQFPAEWDVCTDLPEIAGQGPLAGICTAMRRHPKQRYLVMACDMPRIESTQINRLANLACSFSGADVVAVRTADHAIPLLSVWQHDQAETLQQAVQDHRLSVMKMLDQLQTVWIHSTELHPDSRRFLNYNTPDTHIDE